MHARPGARGPARAAQRVRPSACDPARATQRVRPSACGAVCMDVIAKSACECGSKRAVRIGAHGCDRVRCMRGGEREDVQMSWRVVTFSPQQKKLRH